MKFLFITSMEKKKGEDKSICHPFSFPILCFLQEGSKEKHQPNAPTKKKSIINYVSCKKNWAVRNSSGTLLDSSSLVNKQVVLVQLGVDPMVQFGLFIRCGLKVTLHSDFVTKGLFVALKQILFNYFWIKFAPITVFKSCNLFNIFVCIVLPKNFLIFLNNFFSSSLKTQFQVGGTGLQAASSNFNVWSHNPCVPFPTHTHFFFTVDH